MREAEHRADVAKRALLGALRAAFVTPLEPEDVFALSRGVDWILDYARDLVSESEAMACPPDAVIAEMAALLGGGGPRDRPGALPPRQRRRRGDRRRRCGDPGRAKARARLLPGMGALLEVEDRSERISRRELYRRCPRIGEMVIDVAERVVYAVVKQN